jgi:hypothetical protein
MVLFRCIHIDVDTRLFGRDLEHLIGVIPEHLASAHRLRSLHELAEHRAGKQNGMSPSSLVHRHDHRTPGFFETLNEQVDERSIHLGVVHRANEHAIDLPSAKRFETGADGREHPLSISFVDDGRRIPEPDLLADAIRFVS